MKPLDVGIKVFLFCGVLLTATPGQAADKIAGSFTVDGQPATLAHGFGWIDADRQIHVSLFAAQPDAKEQTQEMGGSTPETGVFAKPSVHVVLSFAKGATEASLQTLTSCNVGYRSFEYGPYAFHSSIKDACGATALSGRLAPGSQIQGKLKAETQSMFPRNGHKAKFTWDVNFSATVRAKP